MIEQFIREYWFQLFQSIFFTGSLIAAALAYKNVRKQLNHAEKVAQIDFLRSLQIQWQSSHFELAAEFYGGGLFYNLTPEYECKREEKHFELKGYINFFEMIAIARENDAVKLKQVDDLFGHRFVRLYSNNWVTAHIINHHDYHDGYKMFRKFGDEWIDFRKTLGRPHNYNSVVLPTNEPRE